MRESSLMTNSVTVCMRQSMRYISIIFSTLSILTFYNVALSLSCTLRQISCNRLLLFERKALVSLMNIITLARERTEAHLV